MSSFLCCPSVPSFPSNLSRGGTRNASQETTLLGVGGGTREGGGTSGATLSPRWLNLNQKKSTLIGGPRRMSGLRPRMQCRSDDRRRRRRRRLRNVRGTNGGGKDPTASASSGGAINLWGERTHGERDQGGAAFTWERGGGRGGGKKLVFQAGKKGGQEKVSPFAPLSTCGVMRLFLSLSSSSFLLFFQKGNA